MYHVHCRFGVSGAAVQINHSITSSFPGFGEKKSGGGAAARPELFVYSSGISEKKGQLPSDRVFTRRGKTKQVKSNNAIVIIAGADSFGLP